MTNLLDVENLTVTFPTRSGTFDAVRILADMRRARVIEPLDADAVQKLRAVPASPVPLTRNQVLAWLTGVVPVLLLASLVWWAASGSAAPGPGLALLTSAHREVRDAYATRRLRHAIEVHRFATGNWPASLGQLAAGPLPEGALAAPEGASYYYDRRDGGALVLAPAR